MSMGANFTPGSPGDDDLLARATAALQRTPMVDGPSTQALDQTLAALDAAASSSQTRFAFRRKTMFALLKMAAAVLVAAGSLFYLGGPYLVGAPVAFEAVAQKLQNAHTLSYVMTMEFPDAKAAVPMTMRHLFKEPGLVRSETLPAGGPIMIFDQKADKTLAIDPAAKTAVLLEGRLPGANRGDKELAISEAQYLRSLTQKKGEPIGEKAFGKVQAQGFRVKDDAHFLFELIIWVDPQAQLPVQVEITGKAGDTPFHSTIRDFELDPKLDDSLFSQEAPQGYAFSRLTLSDPNDKDDGSPEAAVGKLLRGFAEKSAGTFPQRLDDWAAYDRLTPKGTYKSPTDPALIRNVWTTGRVQMFLLERKGDYGYKADGVKLGDANKILFWYKPKDKQTYRALFGDLHAADVTADQLPAAEKPQAKP
jgi:outer membrane lipoprotein-sorting protein